MPNALQIPVIRRAASVMPASIDVAAREIDVTWTTGSRVQRYDWYDGDYLEELSLDDGAADLTRLNNGAPLLDTHMTYSLEHVLGVVVEGSARIENGEGVARVRFASDDADVEKIWNKVRQGVVRNISVGYLISEVSEIRQPGAMTILRATKWEPLEISFVPVGADAGAGSRGAEARTFPCLMKREGDMTTKPKVNPGTEPEPVVDPENPETRAAPVNPAPVAVDADGIRAEVFETVSNIIERCSLANMTASDALEIITATRGKSPAEISTAVQAKRATLASRTNVREISGHTNPDADTTGLSARRMAAKHAKGAK
ncbi:MAG: hypothetical protein Q7S99_05310 [Parvibaculum sp.]|nr:hypothetical protein [Parvibaculum sp.]